jgi:hypothetical protein
VADVVIYQKDLVHLLVVAGEIKHQIKTQQYQEVIITALLLLEIIILLLQVVELT